MTIGPKKLYDCPCGKQHKSRDTVRRHRLKKEAAGQPIGQSDVGADGPIQKIDLKEEYQKMTKEIETKPPEKKEPLYRHNCGATFDEKHRYCPGCGQELEWPR